MILQSAIVLPKYVFKYVVTNKQSFLRGSVGLKLKSCIKLTFEQFLQLSSVELSSVNNKIIFNVKDKKLSNNPYLILRDDANENFGFKYFN